MAGALRKVSLNYNWTIKRAQNDLHHNIITPQPQPQPTPPSFSDTKPGDFSVLPWDSNRLRWKFKNDYEELREHLECAFLILFGWAVTLNHLRPIATRHFINHPIRSVVVLYEESGNLAHFGISPTSIWGWLVALSRFVAPFIISWFWEIFGAFLLIHAPEASAGGKTDTSFVSQLVEHPVVAKEPEKAPQVSNDSDVQAPVKGHTGYDTSDAAPPLPAMSVTDDLKGGNETIPIVTQHDDTRRFSLRKARSHNDIESDNARKVRPGLITRESFHVHGSQPSPKSPDSTSLHVEARAVRMGHLTDDVFALGDYSILAHNPAVFAP
ncbi:hypothetical protein F5888DRAFT_1874203 [Russula emetica]|nr:hypothetical protein F5888DRAFT_1874203 [Russula emetica]